MVATAAGCTSGEGGQRRARNPNLVTGDELRQTQAATVYDALARTRPQFLRARGPNSLSDPVPQEARVYLDGVQAVDGVDALKRLRTDVIDYVRYLSASDATTRYGTGHGGGAIEVRTLP